MRTERGGYEIKKMPDQETLEAYLEGNSGTPKVIFNKDEGEFEWLDKRDPNLGQPKTEWARLQRLHPHETKIVIDRVTGKKK